MKILKYKIETAHLIVIVSLLSGLFGYGQMNDGAPSETTYSEELDLFGTQLDSLRRTYKVPGLSVAVVQQDSILFLGGFGYADFDSERPAIPETTYRIASLTKPIAATVLMQQVEEGNLSLRDSIKKLVPGYEQYYSEVRDYVLANQPEFAPMIQDLDFGRDDITVRHHLTHTAENVPGDGFKYNGFLFGALSRVMEKKLGLPFHEILENEVLVPCDMGYSAPSQEKADDMTIKLLARPYEYLVEKDKFVASEYPDPDVNAASGIVSNVIDLVKFDRAINGNRLIDHETQETMWTRQRNNAGEEIPYGLGWFVQHRDGNRAVWHYGWHPEAFSGLYLKFPESGLTLILLANGENLSAPFIESGYQTDVFASPFAKLFYDTFLPVTE